MLNYYAMCSPGLGKEESENIKNMQNKMERRRNAQLIHEQINTDYTDSDRSIKDLLMAQNAGGRLTRLGAKDMAVLHKDRSWEYFNHADFLRRKQGGCSRNYEEIATGDL